MGTGQALAMGAEASSGQRKETAGTHLNMTGPSHPRNPCLCHSYCLV
ncbi:rCG62258 [Rattus norvegicus]|uniref:RCG62258 n=1 Tax=Rattus norvegicus TaxID=10116 RepID=A6HAY6_RAT|nr:rCG62258 [Rattus norvegicus]